jgi:hypothetical protein
MINFLRSIKPTILGLDRNNNMFLNRRGGVHQRTWCVDVKQITSAQLLALFATPQIVVPAPGNTASIHPAGYAIIPTMVMVHKPAGVAYAGVAAGEDLVLKYTNAAGQQISSAIETTGFLDQTTAQTRVAFPPASTGATAADITPVLNAAVVMHLLVGEIITGDSPIYVKTFYDLQPLVFTHLPTLV